MKLLNRLFGRTKTGEAASDSLTLTAAAKKILTAHTSLIKIASDYGAVLASSAAPPPGCVADARKLPHPKEQIKNALVYALGIVEDPQMRSALKICYISLANWQEGVGDIDTGLNVTKIDPSGDIHELAKWIVASEKWLLKARAERESLVGELHKLGLWDSSR
ncbi:MAG TPA: hypothetical protein VNM15_04115 [Candidatus Binatia bacterium]|nr:hypothetical protein [Candidatus Binatia bacterium]